MENVTLTPKEQSRLQVLNSVAAEHMTLDQAAELMGVTQRHARRVLASYRESGAAALAHGHRGRRPVNATPAALVADVVRLARTRLRRRQSHPPGGTAGGAGRRPYRQDHPATGPAGCWAEQSPTTPSTQAPSPSATDAARGDADPDGRQPSPVVGRPDPGVHVADRGGRCHRQGDGRPVL